MSNKKKNEFVAILTDTGNTLTLSGESIKSVDRPLVVSGDGITDISIEVYDNITGNTANLIYTSYNISGFTLGTANPTFNVVLYDLSEIGSLSGYFTYYNCRLKEINFGNNNIGAATSDQIIKMKLQT
jgi:hypothetical protein